MLTVNLKPQLHRNQDCVLIDAPNSSAINNALKKIAGIKFSKTYRNFYLPICGNMPLKLRRKNSISTS